ncbi:MAG: glycerophosphodiester phosphodiesterase family protein [Bryobacteraceae bacterium]
MRATLVLLLVALAAAQYRGPTLIAHRGASAYAPENTLPAYRLAIEQGADYVEQDLQITKDGVLVCLHDLTLERTTDAAEVFPDGYRVENGRRRWYVSDFTAAQIRRLDAGAKFGERFRGTRIPTWREAIAEIRGKAGIYPETKAPEVYGSRGFDMERLVLEELRQARLDWRTPVVIQSFSAESLKKMTDQLGSKLPKVFLISARDAGKWSTVEALGEVRRFAVGIGPEKSIVRNDPALVARAHGLGLSVTIWTLEGDRDEMARFLKLGVDALFTNNPDRFPR